MKALATIGAGPMAPVLDVALQSFRPYAARHGYDLVIGSGWSDHRPPAWGKVLLLRQLLQTYDEALWLDCDMVVVDGRTDVAEVVPDTAFQAFVRHPLVDGELVPNAGLWFLRSGGAAESFLDEVWNYSGDVNAGGMWDNQPILELLGYTPDWPFRLARPSPWAEGTAYLPIEWNTPATGVRDPAARVLHFMSMPTAKRTRAMRLATIASDGSGEGKRKPFHRQAEWYLRRTELSLYFRRRGVRDTLVYKADRRG